MLGPNISNQMSFQSIRTLVTQKVTPSIGSIRILRYALLIYPFSLVLLCAANSSLCMIDNKQQFSSNTKCPFILTLIQRNDNRWRCFLRAAVTPSVKIFLLSFYQKRKLLLPSAICYAKSTLNFVKNFQSNA